MVAGSAVPPAAAPNERSRGAALRRERERRRTRSRAHGRLPFNDDGRVVRNEIYSHLGEALEAAGLNE
jgi:hypothetical protein